MHLYFPALGTWRQEKHKFQVILLGYIPNLSLARTTWDAVATKNVLLKKKKTEKIIVAKENQKKLTPSDYACRIKDKVWPWARIRALKVCHSVDSSHLNCTAHASSSTQPGRQMAYLISRISLHGPSALKTMATVHSCEELWCGWWLQLWMF